MAAEGVWRVKPGRVVYDDRQTVKATGGMELPFDDPDALKNRAAVVLLFDEDRPEEFEEKDRLRWGLDEPVEDPTVTPRWGGASLTEKGVAERPGD